MSTITAILEPDPDGSLHLPLPAELRGGKVKVNATLESVTAGGLDTDRHRVTEARLQQRRAALAALRADGGLGAVIPDPVTWQRELRQERPLPGRG